MDLRGRRIHIAGSAAANADEGKLEYAHCLIAELTTRLTASGATFIIPFGKEPFLKDRSTGPSITFDWTVAEVIGNALATGNASPSSIAGRLISTVSTTRTDAHIPETRRTLYDALRNDGAIEIAFLRAGWTAGALQRQRLAQLGDVLIAVSGGQGVEHLAVEYSSRGKPVVPLDLQLGASSGDGSGGAARLFDRALEDPSSFFRITNKRAAADLLDGIKTRGGDALVTDVVNAVITLLNALTPPRVFYVRILNSKLADYPSVEDFFRTTVDSLVEQLGFERREMGLGDNEFAWMNEAIFQLLHHSSVVLVDVTGLRPNCFVELGYALGNQQRVIFTARDGTDFPFDVFAIEAFLWKDGEDPKARLARFRTHWERNINMPRLVRPNEAR
jgi:hypothetical protein